MIDLEGALRADVAGLYEVEREIGHGGMGSVYLATEIRLGRKVAIKVLPPLYSFGEGAVERFRREARTAATLDHPNVIPIYRVSEGDALSWYAMKYVEGETLDDLMRREGALPPDRTVAIVAQVADALHYAHRRGIIHRDIKPSNVMLDADGRVTVTDFGIAKATGSASITGSGSILGTPHYMSPEQCSGTPLTPAADQYAVGVLTYQMLTGVLPYAGDSPVDIIKRHCFDPIPLASSVRPDLPPAVSATIERSMAKEAEARFPSVKDFADALAHAAHLRGPGTERIAPKLTRATPRKRSAAAMGVGAAGLVVVTGIAWMLLKPSQGAAPGASDSMALAAPVATSSPPADTSRPQAAAPESASVELQAVPAGAVIRLDGRRTAGPRFRVASGSRHTVEVTATGFAPWTSSFTPRPGQTIQRTVALVPARDSAPGSAAPSGGSGFIRVGTAIGGSPVPAALFINGRRTPSNPVSDFPVPIGPVRIVAEYTDSVGGVWRIDTTVAVVAGEVRNLRRVQLQPVRP